MKDKAILFILGFFIWMFIAWPLDMQHFWAGIIVVSLVIFLISDLFKVPGMHFGRISRYHLLLYFLILFLIEFLKAGFWIFLIVIRPNIALDSRIIKIKTCLKSESALTFLATAITFTAGALCIDLDQDEGLIYVHLMAIDTQAAQAVIESKARRFEGVLKRIFE